MKLWTPQELEILQRMRARFLEGTAGAADYWRGREELALYDATFAERIGWKWDAVLQELTRRDWSPRSRRIVDWGCGSGVAGRRVIEAWPHLERIALHDRSWLAMQFAAERARAARPEIALEQGAEVDAGTLLVLSHVISELKESELSKVVAMIERAGEVIWVEAGTHADSRRLSAVRDRVLESTSGAVVPIGPCTHQERCGMLAPKNGRHWCHFFARPPSAIFQDSRWMEFGREMGIDLRSLPLSFLVLQREGSPLPAGYARVIGAPRAFKGYSKVLSCQAAGVEEFMLQKRDAPALLRELGDLPEVPVYRWTMNGGRIAGGEKLA